MLPYKTCYCGTLQLNCKYIPKDIMNKKLKRGNKVSKLNEKCVKTGHWKDKKKCHYFINCSWAHRYHGAYRKEARFGEEILKPSSVIEYNKAKKGVNMSNQMSMYHTTLRKKKKWHQKHAIELITGMVVFNALVLYNNFFWMTNLHLWENLRNN